MSSGAVQRLTATVSATVAGGITDPPTPRSPRLRRGRFDLVFLADLLIGIISLATTDSWLETQNGRHGHPFGTETLLLFAVAVSVPVVLRTRFPASAWALSALAVGWTAVVIGPRLLSSAVYVPAGLLVYGLCLYSIAVRCRAWFVVTAAIITLVGAILIDAPTSAGAILAAIPLLIGAVVRSRRSGQAELAQQARRLEGERALLEERQRIARELHDIVAHHMSVIAIQAEAAPRKVAHPPPELAESFAEIRASALTGLNELRRLLGVLRSGGSDTAPQPGLDELDGLLESARSGGVRVTSSVSGTPRSLPQGMDLSAYRILQEALSNAMRHAPGSAVRVEVAYAPRSLVLKVRNDTVPGAPHDENGAGHGIIGMRERAVMLGGQLEAGPTQDGSFLVTAVLPDAKNQVEGSS